MSENWIDGLLPLLVYLGLALFLLSSAIHFYRMQKTHKEIMSTLERIKAQAIVIKAKRELEESRGGSVVPQEAQR